MPQMPQMQNNFFNTHISTSEPKPSLVDKYAK